MHLAALVPTPLFTSLVLSRVALTSLVAGAPQAEAEIAIRETWAMGTRVRIVAEAPDRGTALLAAEGALREIERLDRLLSTWDGDSELGEVNAAAPGVAVPVSRELAEMLHEMEGWAGRTGRAFDPGIGALVDAWDTRGGGRTPTTGQLEAALSATGYGVVEVADRRATRRFRTGWIDSGGFGKGAALRSVAASAEVTRASRILVDVGGQIWSAHEDVVRSVEVAHPAERTRPVALLEVAGVSVATSGSSERPGHLLDPRTGVPVPAWGSVTVVSPDPVEADVLATALYVMGPGDGLAWAREARVPALFLELEGRGVRASWTERMDEWLLRLSDAEAVGRGDAYFGGVGPDRHLGGLR